jgi:hypothetical protein
MRTSILVGLTSALAALLGACVSSDPVDLGRDEAKVLGSALSDYAGTWEGYAEAYSFDDGTDRVRLEMGADGRGELWVGSAGPLAPPEADRGYPPSSPNETEEDRLVSGYPYPIVDGAIEETRIRLHSSSGDVYREWCELMTPHLVTNATPSHYACLPFSGFGTNEQGECTNGADLDMVIDCGLTHCLGQCECTESACSISSYLAESDVLIDATLEGEGDSFVGTLVIDRSRITVRLARM